MVLAKARSGLVSVSQRPAMNEWGSFGSNRSTASEEDGPFCQGLAIVVGGLVTPVGVPTVEVAGVHDRGWDVLAARLEFQSTRWWLVDIHYGGFLHFGGDPLYFGGV